MMKSSYTVEKPIDSNGRKERQGSTELCTTHHEERKKKHADNQRVIDDDREHDWVIVVWILIMDPFVIYG